MLVFKKNAISKITIVCPESFRKHVLQITYTNLFFPNKEETLGRNGLTQISLSSYQNMKGYLLY